ncbi:MAG: hypothetical protein OXN96_13705 [Bryobacterales bacterium]|nr:hypothetical protein [Bryobacterales bacterium]
MGSALGAVFTRDVYCRFLAPNAQERGSLAVTRIAAVACVALSFVYIPFLGQGMVAFYLRLSSVAVVPLATVFAVGAWTRAHPRSGIVGMLAGVSCGLVSMLGDRLAWPLPEQLTGVWWSYWWAVAVTGGAMAVCSVLLGPADAASLRGLTLASCRRGERYGGAGDGWLERSRAAVAKETGATQPESRRWRPERTTLLLISAAAVLFFVAFR